ncbi:MAG: hypothetical protein HY465_02840 [Deltaproteobacteria bacterium]|nr:hypothetical protein [Deltaproteobacteria bacterium]
MNGPFIAAAVSLLYLFAASLRIGVDATLVDASLLTKIAAVSIAISFLFRFARRHQPPSSEVKLNERASTSFSDHAWCQALAQCLCGRVWLLDDRLRVVATDRPGEDAHRHVIDLVGKATAREALAIVGEIKKGASSARGVITYEGQHARLILASPQGPWVIMAITKEE